MTCREFQKLFKDKIVLLDGATGTQMHHYGMPVGVCPEKWAMENPEALLKVQSAYREAGTKILYTFTFGGSSLKLEDYGLSEQTYEINRRLAAITREAGGGACLTAGDISSCGALLAPFGQISFEESVESFKAQIKGLIDGGVDLFVIETMMDLQEARAALIAVRELSDLPVMATLTFEPGGRTLMGTDPVSGLVTLQSLGADAVGCNCSGGPAEMVEIIRQMKPYAKVPLIAKPNAGLPKLIDGKTVFDMDAESFSSYAEALVDAGVNALGGCCGTTPEHIQKLTEITAALTPKKVRRKAVSLACSNRRTVEISPVLPMAVIGERLNPTGKKALKEALIKGDMDYVSEMAREQVEAGALLLDVNAGVPGIDEEKTLKAMVHAVCDAVSAPLLLDSSNPAALEASLRIYPGRAVINSVSGEEEKLTKILPLAQKYGAMFVLLPVDDKGVPETAVERIEIIRRVAAQAKKLGLGKDDFLVDGVVMTVASNQDAALEALDVISWCTDKYGVNTVVGLSNVSFGLPARENINSAFLAMAMKSGLSTAIMNPNNEQMMHIKRAGDVLKARDKSGLAYIEWHGAHPEIRKEKLSAGVKPVKTEPQGSYDTEIKAGKSPLFDAILKGSGDMACEIVRNALIGGEAPQRLIDEGLIPAIQEVGRLYEEKRYLLPQLIRGAEAMERAMTLLTPELEKERGPEARDKGTVVLATVKGDVHDIGKNIVGLLLKNYGFKVVDLGKDVSSECIIDAAKANNADIVALSALMTTTMNEMPLVAQKLREEGLNLSVMVGGAVLDKEFAESFGAFYSSDAYSAVRLAETLMEKRNHK